MRIFSEYEEVPQLPPPVAVTIGNFDGVHRGHRALIDKARASVCADDGVVIVLTFSPHPVRILAPHAAPPLVTTVEDKRVLLQGAGVDGVLEQTFTKKFASLSPDNFVRQVLVGALAAKHVIVGYDFSFGARRAGRAADLVALGAQLGFEAHIVEAQRGADGEIASSSRVRACVSSGELERAAGILGRPFHLSGRVVHGAKRGRLIGFPTANLQAETELMPLGGVYSGWLDAEGSGSPTSPRPAVINVGVKPTFGGTTTTVEAHVIGAEGLDLYDRRAHVFFERRIRPEQRFDGIDALVAQIGRDRDTAATDLAGRTPPTSLLHAPEAR